MGSYPTRFILTCANAGGIVSVALSLGLAERCFLERNTVRLFLVAVSNRPALHCPDFPPLPLLAQAIIQ